MIKTLHIALGNQLFGIEHLPPRASTLVFMAEDLSLCTYVRHHKQKLILFLAAMRNYADELAEAGYEVCYHPLEEGDRPSYEDKLSSTLRAFDVRSVSQASPDLHVDVVTGLVERQFSAHPGATGPFWLPVTRAVAREWLDDFLERRLADFGPYEDAISRRSRSLFHSVLSSSLNLGLITPAAVLERAIGAAEAANVPLNSLEGFHSANRRLARVHPRDLPPLRRRAGAE